MNILNLGKPVSLLTYGTKGDQKLLNPRSVFASSDAVALSTGVKIGKALATVGNGMKYLGGGVAGVSAAVYVGAALIDTANEFLGFGILLISLGQSRHESGYLMESFPVSLAKKSFLPAVGVGIAGVGLEKLGKELASGKPLGAVVKNPYVLSGALFAGMAGAMYLLSKKD